MQNCAIVGINWGDEGKGRMVDLLTQDFDVVVRYQGGGNAGHAVVVYDKKYKFHLIPSGILYPGKTCFMGAGVVICPEDFKKELDEIISQGVSFDQIRKSLRISPLAHITMPYHTAIDGWSETDLGEKKIGTTKKGIGPTYTDKYARIGIRIEDLFNDEALNNKLDIILPLKNKTLDKVYGLKTYTKDEVLEKLKEYKFDLKMLI